MAAFHGGVIARPLLYGDYVNCTQPQTVDRNSEKNLDIYNFPYIFLEKICSYAGKIEFPSLSEGK